ncbi:MAG: hypothetical protein WD934_11725 [Gemmatimonadales bacterium]
MSTMLFGLVAVTGALTTNAALEPYLSVRTGLACQACHTNRTGGGNRSMFGNIWAQTQLPARTGVVVPREIAEFLRVGFDLRTEAVGRFRAATPRTAFNLDLAQAYIEARFLDRRLALYVDQTLGPERSFAREAFALLEGLPGDAYIKLGKFLLPYGWRLQDDAEFVRERTGFSYFTPDQGVEVGFAPGRLQFAVALTNGAAGSAESDDGKQVTTQASVVLSHLRLGGSASRLQGVGGRRDVVGGFGGVRLGPLVVLGELDLVRDVGATTTVEQVVGYAEVDWLVRRGLNAKVTYGYLDPNRSLAENQRVRMRFGLEAFPVAFIRLASFYTLLADIPQAVNDLDQVSLEVHIHF